jgi:hypothetical protein
MEVVRSVAMEVVRSVAMEVVRLAEKFNPAEADQKTCPIP